MKKRELIKEKLKKDHGCSGVCSECTKKFIIIDEMHSAGIPVEYWLLTMKEFAGAPKLKEITDEYITNLKDHYLKGRSVCFAGSQGTGKTMAAVCILRAAIKSGFSVYYLTAADLLAEMTDFRNSNDLRHKLREVDFLVIDELDSRFFTSDSTKELFSSVYENLFRYRAQNLMPTIICTNETDSVLNVFYGQGLQSIKSLNARYLTIYPIMGQDFRKKNEAK
jgi:DNA replication protein DnaC